MIDGDDPRAEDLAQLIFDTFAPGLVKRRVMMVLVLIPEDVSKGDVVVSRFLGVETRRSEIYSKVGLALLERADDEGNTTYTDVKKADA